MKNQVVLITGATSMIGEATAKLLSKKGYKLMLAARSKEKLEKLALPAKNCIVDFCSQSDIENMVQETIKAYGRIDSVVQNVAIYPYKSIEELSEKEWEETLTTNLTSSFLTTKACIQVMKKQNSGQFVFMSSIAGETIGIPNMSAYSATKAAINGFMRSCAIELAPYNINANCISPGKVWDPSTLTPEETAEKLQNVPLKRFISPIDCAEMANFLISPAASNITGQNFIIDGGQSIL